MVNFPALAHFIQLFPSNPPPKKYQKTSGFLMFSGFIVKDKCMNYVNKKICNSGFHN